MIWINGGKRAGIDGGGPDIVVDIRRTYWH